MNPQYLEIFNDLLRAFATDLSKHTLKKHMTVDEILALLQVDATSSKSSPAAQPGVEYDGDLSDIPKNIGLGKVRAGKVLALCEAGVPDGMFVHSTLHKLFKPTKQHESFIKNKKSRIAGPKKDAKAIKYLCKKAGKVGPPPEPEVVAELPSKWKGDQKKAKNLLTKVRDRKEEDSEKYVNWFSSRPLPQGRDNLVYNDEYEICGPKEHKADFLNLVAWLDENPDLMEEKTKGKAKVSESGSDSDNGSDGSDNGSDSNGESGSDNGSDGSGNESTQESDGTQSSDDDDDGSDTAYVAYYDQAKLTQLKNKLSKRTDKQYINVDNRKPLKHTKKTAETHYFHKSGIAFEKRGSKQDNVDYRNEVLEMLK